MKLIAMLLGVSSCITADLVPCGSLSCPAGSICIEATETCVIQDQLDACASSADEDLCVTSIGNGVCLNGVCTISRCGDGHLDLGEVCDDGNLASGDGCRQDCRSDETCGNGLLDQFERCDCGSSTATLAKGCTMPNSTDVKAECDPACSRTCGDAMVTGFEQCDGATIPATCAQFGFYSGTPACNDNCSLDTSSCAGRCGAGVVDVAFAEECDMSIPVGSCLAFGRDFGVLGCGNTCTPAVATTCHFMGWRTLFDSSHLFVDAAANVRGAIGTIDPFEGDSVYVRWDGVQSHRDNTGWRWTASTPSVLVAGGPTSLGWFDGTWHDVAATPGVGAQVAATVSGVLFAVKPDCTVTRVDLPTGTSTSIASPTATACRDAVTLGELLFVATDAGIARWDGTSWVVILAGELDQLLRGRPGRLIARQSSDELPVQFFDVDLATTPATAVLLATEDGASLDVGMDIDGTLLLSTEEEGGHIVVGDLRAHDEAPDQLFRIGQTEDGTILGVGYGVYRFEPQYLSLVGSPSEAVLDFTLLPDGAAGYCGAGVVGWLDDAGGGARPWPSNYTCWNLIGDPRGEHLVGAEVFTSGGDGLYRWDEDSESYVLEIAGRVDDLAGTPGAAFAVIDGAMVVQNGASWDPVAMPNMNCIVEGIESYGDELFALTGCPPTYDGTVQRWNGATLEPIATYPAELYTLEVTPDGTVFVAGSGKLLRLDGTTFVELPVDGLIVAATSKDDLYINGFDPVRGEGTLYHLQNGTLSQIRAPYRVLAATPQHLYAYDGDIDVDSLVALPRLPVRLAGDGL